MRSKTPLALMEQVVMVLVFALAAALCLQVFELADRTSRRNEAIDRAVQVCQTAAETLKAAGGDVAHAQQAAAARMGGAVEEGLWYVLYNENWKPVDGIDEAVYALYVRGAAAQTDGMVKADVWAETCEVDGGELFSLTVVWQEVSGNG